MATEDYVKLKKKALDARKHNKKSWDGAKKELTESRSKLKSCDAKVRDLLIKIKGLQTHASDVYGQWEALANQIIDLQKVAKNDKSKAAEIEKQIDPLHKQAQTFREQFAKAIDDYPEDQLAVLRKMLSGLKL
ncbi:MAG: hypothetical protein AAGC57_19720 [Pseudomonadota bacterium]